VLHQPTHAAPRRSPHLGRLRCEPTVQGATRPSARRRLAPPSPRLTLASPRFRRPRGASISRARAPTARCQFAHTDEEFVLPHHHRQDVAQGFHHGVYCKVRAAPRPPRRRRALARARCAPRFCPPSPRPAPRSRPLPADQAVLRLEARQLPAQRRLHLWARRRRAAPARRVRRVPLLRGDGRLPLRRRVLVRAPRARALAPYHAQVSKRKNSLCSRAEQFVSVVRQPRAGPPASTPHPSVRSRSPHPRPRRGLLPLRHDDDAQGAEPRALARARARARAEPLARGLPPPLALALALARRRPDDRHRHASQPQRGPRPPPVAQRGRELRGDGRADGRAAPRELGLPGRVARRRLRRAPPRRQPRGRAHQDADDLRRPSRPAPRRSTPPFPRGCAATSPPRGS
jgi:hypothetical protein